MRICDQCGLSMGDTATFCPVCGARPGVPSPPPSVACAVCGHPGPLVEVDGVRLCAACHGALELLVQRNGGGPPGGGSVMLRPDDIAAFLEYAAGNRLRLAAETVELYMLAGSDQAGPAAPDDGSPAAAEPPQTAQTPQAPLAPAPQETAPEAAGDGTSGQDEQLRRMLEAAETMRAAKSLEKTDPVQAGALYRQAILGYLEVTEDPLEREIVRRDLLSVFNRLTIVLKRLKLEDEALEEIECAASLGLLGCEDPGTRTSREALLKRRASLLRALEKATA